MRRLLLALVLAAPASLAAQAPPEPAAEDQPVFRTGTAVVLLDVLVRDRSGRPVPDVRPEEIEVFEDGVRQKVEAFRWVQTDAPRVEDAAPAARPDVTRQVNLVSLVFDQLGPDGRRLAAKAASTFLDNGLRPNTWVAVFQIDQRLALIQPFTNELARLRQAVTLATSGTYKGVLDERTAADQALKGGEKSKSNQLHGYIRNTTLRAKGFTRNHFDPPRAAFQWELRSRLAAQDRPPARCVERFCPANALFLVQSLDKLWTQAE